MLATAWNFIKRHKKKFMFTGAVVGGIAILGKYAKKKLQDFQDHEAADCLMNARRMHHFDSNQRTCNMTVMSMLPTLRQRVIELLDSDSLTSQLKNRPTNKMEIWEELKVIGFARTIMAVYSCSMLVVFLRVQLNILAGYMYLDSCSTESDTSGGRASAEVQTGYLGWVQHLVDQGLADLARDVRAAVSASLTDTSLKQQVSLADIQQKMSIVRSIVEQGGPENGCVSRGAPQLVRYMLAAEEMGTQAIALSPSQAILAELRAETLDMLESGDFNTVLDACLDTGFTRVIDQMAEFFTPTQAEDGTITNPSQLSMPLAKLVPILNGLVHTVLADAPNQFAQELLLKEQVKDFAANVYEAFCQPSAEHTPG